VSEKSARLAEGTGGLFRCLYRVKSQAEVLRSMRKGEPVIVIRGEYAGRGGRIRRRSRDGRYIVNLDSPHGIPMSPLLRASEIRRAQKATGPAKT